MEKTSALKLHAADNVVTVLRETAPGETVRFFAEGEVCSLTAAEAVPAFHKLALGPLPRGARVVKYGEAIGRAMTDIPAGGWVSHRNLESVHRDYDAELREE